LAVNLVLFIAGGIVVLSLAFNDVWQRREAESILLSAWVLGTFVFAVFFNWTVNARSILPLVPPAAILITRRLDDKVSGNRFPDLWKIVLPITVSLAVGLWLAAADVSLADSAREAARLVLAKTSSEPGKVFFSGHWGFQYYMEAQGAHPADIGRKEDIQPSDAVVRPENNTNVFSFPPEIIASSEPVEVAVNHWISPLRKEMGAGFYSSVLGPLPYAFGRVPPERYSIIHLKPLPFSGE
jgi:hypothetical protein